MSRQLRLGDITVEVVLKNIKNIHLSVHPPAGQVRVSAPSRMSLKTVRLFIISKWGWIKRHQEKFREQFYETPYASLDRGSLYLWGQRYLFEVVESEETPSMELGDCRILLKVRPGTDERKRNAAVDGWYRGLLKEAVPPLIAKWEPPMGVKVERFFVQRMKTRWGSCNPQARNIRVNTELAKRPRECLEYVVVHEMVHLLERSHNDRFHALMDAFMPDWPYHRDRLNRPSGKRQELSVAY